ncbi:hypothetical protein SAMN02745126_06050 [Enhydrobacter aerosaccus]|uniref:Uncharacterized protein n=1 Tax=Enhydrobacter aerosaccus TaxID=225324 RepID=A0A1T4TDS3_9HYPH|nr:hypothetical protein [Enhydrobacter aerosaccus]SKA38566.1 hypothetical protein SAMN02745126_06050 [Enhydrobacter aerosaccus]
MGLLLKFVMLGVVAYVAWNTARRWLGLLGGSGANRPVSGNRQTPAARSASPAPAAPRRPVVEDTKACPVCGAYVSVSAGKCGRSDCPQG